MPEGAREDHTAKQRSSLPTDISTESPSPGIAEKLTTRPLYRHHPPKSVASCETQSVNIKLDCSSLITQTIITVMASF